MQEVAYEGTGAMQEVAYEGTGAMLFSPHFSLIKTLLRRKVQSSPSSLNVWTLEGDARWMKETKYKGNSNIPLCNLILDFNTPDILFYQGHLFWYVLYTVWTDFLHSFSCIWAFVSISLGCLGKLRMREYIYSLICFTHRQHELSFSQRRTP